MNSKVKHFFGSVKNQAAVAGFTALVGFSNLAHAADGDVDATAVLAVVALVAVAAGLIGAAVLAVKAGIKGWKMIAGAM